MNSTARETMTTFWLGDHLLGVRATDVREVIQDPTVTAIPLSPPVLGGVFNIRGELVTVLDLRRRLGLPDRQAGACIHMLVPTADGTVSLLVDRQGDVIEVDQAWFEPPPGGMAETARDCIRGAYKLPGHLLVVLDTARLFDLSAFDEEGNEGRERGEPPA
jgi:purine-binding chemotaxis protein CheW